MNVNKSLAVSFILPAVHLGICIAVRLGMLGAEGSWGWFLVFLIDLPFSLLLFPLQNLADPLLVFGSLGTGWWYMISRVAIYIVRRVSKRHQAVLR